MKTSVNGRRFIERWEGLFLHTYNDGVGVPTIGYGHTTAAGPPSVSYGQKITREDADRILAVDLGKVERQVAHAVNVPLTQNQFDALVSFTFNLGPGGLAKLVAASGLNNGGYARVPAHVMNFNHGGGHVMAGLTHRRRGEGAMWSNSHTPEAAAPQTPRPEQVAQKPGIFARVKELFA